MRHLRLVGQFIRASFQQELAYRANLFVSLLHSLLNLVTGVLTVTILFNQVEKIAGWDFPAMLALLGVYLMARSAPWLFHWTQSGCIGRARRRNLDRSL